MTLPDDPLTAVRDTLEQIEIVRARDGDVNAQIALANTQVVYASTVHLKELTQTVLDGLRRIETKIDALGVLLQDPVTAEEPPKDNM